MLRFLDAGESHGKALVAILEGIPSNCSINIDDINKELLRRQGGYGRGSRMKIEKDRIELWSGVRGSKTTGNPITLVIYNKDYENWQGFINKEPEEDEKITIPRPGHGDLVGYLKYKTGDIRNTIERASARETAIRTGVGALCRGILSQIGINIRSMVLSLGDVKDTKVDIFNDEIYSYIEKSEVRCFSKDKEEEIKKSIDLNKKQGDTLGGSIFLSIKGVPPGIGSFTQWDRKLDGILSYAVMSVQGMKALEFGNGLKSYKGSYFNDEIILNEGIIKRRSNNSGGIEAGVSNGENIEFTAYMKPIPTIKKPIKSVDLNTMKEVESRYERSDVTGVIPASIVLENVIAFEILKEIMNKFNSDTFEELYKSIEDYRKEINSIIST